MSKISHKSLLLLYLLPWLGLLGYHFAPGSFPAPSSQAWYLAASGSDENDCASPLTPCASITAAIARPGFAAGDTIFMAGGFYLLNPPQTLHLAQTLTLSGSWDPTFGYQGVQTSELYFAESAGPTVAISSSVVMQNIRISSLYETGLTNYGRLTLQDVNIGCAYGNSLFNSGTLTMTNSLIGQGSGNGIRNTGTMIMTDTIVNANDSTGIVNTGKLVLYNSTVGDNYAAYGCGGIANHGDLRLVQSAIVKNETHYSGPGGGLCNWGRAILVNSTVSGNQISAGDFLYGGGIYNHGGDLQLFNTTVSRNQGAVYGGGIYNEDSAAGVVQLQNSIVSNNGAPGEENDCGGPIQSLGYVLVSTTANCIYTEAIGDKLNINGQVFSVIGSENLIRGAPPYAPLRLTSPAIDGGNPAGCRDPDGTLLATDQRGFSRLNRCDMGAYEYDPKNDPLQYLWLPIMFVKASK